MSAPSAPEASVRNTALPGSVRQISVVSVSPGNTGEVNRDAIEVTLAAIALAELGDQRAARHAVGAQPVQDRLGETGQLAGEPRVAVQRVAVAGEPVDQRLILAGGQRDAGVGLAVRDFRRDRPLTRLPPEAARAADDQRGQRFGDELPRVGVSAAAAQHHDRVLALALVLDVGDLGDHRQLSRRRQRCVQPDASAIRVSSMAQLNVPILPAAPNAGQQITA